ncbi:MAG: hypothetical protein V2A58_18475 [Planctomycetota bacterium]
MSTSKKTVSRVFVGLVLATALVHPIASAGWTEYAGNPVLTGDSFVDAVAAPRVLEIDGSYQMWYAGYVGGSGWDIYHATSTNGFDWTPEGSVFSSGGQVYLGTVRYDGAGTYQMWYSLGGGTGQTGYATSSDGASWTDHGIVLGPSETYDGYAASRAYVMYDEDASLYKMWYRAGASLSVPRTIAYATSTDGLHWDKYGVVFSGASGSWCENGVGPAFVEKTSTGYTMWFQGWDDTAGRIGSVSSVDGLNWPISSMGIELYPGAPGSWDSATVSDVWLLTTSEGKRLMYFSGGISLPEGSDGIGVAVVPVPGALLLGVLGVGISMLIRRTISG